MNMAESTQKGLNELFNIKDGDALFSALAPSDHYSLFFWGFFIIISLFIAASLDKSKPKNKDKQWIIIGILISVMTLRMGVSFILEDMILLGVLNIIFPLLILFLTIQKIRKMMK